MDLDSIPLQHKTITNEHFSDSGHWCSIIWAWPYSVAERRQHFTLKLLGQDADGQKYYYSPAPFNASSRFFLILGHSSEWLLNSLAVLNFAPHLRHEKPTRQGSLSENMQTNSKHHSRSAVGWCIALCWCRLRYSNLGKAAPHVYACTSKRSQIWSWAFGFWLDPPATHFYLAHFKKIDDWTKNHALPRDVDRVVLHVVPQWARGLGLHQLKTS